MAVTFGFYNASNHDRLYNAEQVSQLFDGLIQNGIYETIGGAMTVSPGTGMSVNVAPGRAWFDHTWTYNDAILPLELEESVSVIGRIDAVVLEIDARIDKRTNTIKVITGTPSSEPQKPELINTDQIHQYPLAYVTVGPDVTSIGTGEIENMVGTEQTPFVIGVVKTMEIDFIVNEWEGQWEEVLADFNNWQNTERELFIEWFDNLKLVLEPDVATNLALQIEYADHFFVDSEGYFSINYDHVKRRID